MVLEVGIFRACCCLLFRFVVFPVIFVYSFIYFLLSHFYSLMSYEYNRTTSTCITRCFFSFLLLFDGFVLHTYFPRSFELFVVALACFQCLYHFACLVSRFLFFAFFVFLVPALTQDVSAEKGEAEGSTHPLLASKRGFRSVSSPALTQFAHYAEQAPRLQTPPFKRRKSVSSFV